MAKHLQKYVIVHILYSGTLTQAIHITLQLAVIILTQKHNIEFLYNFFQLSLAY